MPLDPSQTILIKEEQNTPGGTTYWVVDVHNGEKQERAVCYRLLNGLDKKGQGFRCNRPAGMGTNHYGSGACRLHGGVTSLSTLKTGRSAVVTRTVLQDKIEEFLSGDLSDLSDLSLELAAMRAIFHEYLENFPQIDEDNYGIALVRATKLVASIGTLLEKISKIEARNTLTAAQALYLQATVADILLKHLPDVTLRELAVKELTNRISGVEIGNKISVIQKESWDVEKQD